MANSQVRTAPAVSADDIRSLQATLRGQALSPLSDGYDAVRAVFNGMIDRRPAVIVRCAGVSDVLRALDFATVHGLAVAVRCGGHSVAGHAVCDQGLMLDLSTMTSVYVDPIAKTARAEGGVNWGQFDVETQAFGLATTGGLVRSTGIAGLTLAGGHGFLMRKYGLACDNLISADVVTANGSLVKASAQDNPDLFWALRGGGGNFGVVTSFQYRLHEVGPVTAGFAAFPFSAAAQFLRLHDEVMASAPDDQMALAALATLPTGQKAVVNVACHAGSPDAAERDMAPLRRAATPLMDQIQVMPYTAAQSIVENFNPRGMRNYWKTVYVRELKPEVIEILTSRYAGLAKAPLTHIVIYSFGGAVARVPANATAVNYRDARHAIICIGMWDNPADDGEMKQWVRDTADLLRPYAYGSGFYPNYEADAPPESLALAFGADKYAKLVNAKRKWDPDNIFRLNPNIPPD